MVEVQSRRSRKARRAAGPVAAAADAARPDAIRIGSDVARHVVPLVGVVVFGGSVAQFLLLCVFNIAWTIAGIGLVGVAVSTAPSREEIDRLGTLDSWVTMVATAAFIGLLLTGLSGWLLVLLAGREAGASWDAAFAWAVLAIVIGSAPGLQRRYREDLSAGLGEPARRRRDQPEVFVQLLLLVVVWLLSALALDWGRAGAIVLAIVMTAVFIACDLRPQVVRAWAR
jgi:hypothetical protein